MNDDDWPTRAEIQGALDRNGSRPLPLVARPRGHYVDIATFIRDVLDDIRTERRARC